MVRAAVRKPRVPNDKLHRVTDNRLAEADRKVLHGVCRWSRHTYVLYTYVSLMCSVKCLMPISPCKNICQLSRPSLIDGPDMAMAMVHGQIAPRTATVCKKLNILQCANI